MNNKKTTPLKLATAQRDCAQRAIAIGYKGQSLQGVIGFNKRKGKTRQQRH